MQVQACLLYIHFTTLGSIILLAYSLKTLTGCTLIDKVSNIIIVIITAKRGPVERTLYIYKILCIKLLSVSVMQAGV